MGETTGKEKELNIAGRLKQPFAHYWDKLGEMGILPKDKAREFAAKGYPPPLSGGATPMELIDVARGIEGLPEDKKREIIKTANQFHILSSEEQASFANKLGDLIADHPESAELAHLAAMITEERGYFVRPGEKSRLGERQGSEVRSGTGLRAHEVRRETVSTDEGEVEIPIYGDLDFPTIQNYLREHLDALILSDRSPNLKSYYEWKEVYGLVEAARQLAIKEKTQTAQSQAKDVRMEYEAVKGALMWYLDAATQFDKNGGGFSKGDKTFNDGVTMGKVYSVDLWNWLKNSHRGKGFIHGFATPRAGFKNIDFTDPNEYLGAQLRASIGLGTKDDVERGVRKPESKAGAEFIWHDGRKIKVVKANGQVVERTGPSNGDMYEVHKRATMDTYAFKYIEKRHEMMDLIYEPSHKDPVTQEWIFICHLSPDRMWTYDALQNPKYMAKFWYANIDILASEECNSADLPAGERGRDFLRQLGWRDFVQDKELNDQLNKLYLGDGDNFLKSQVTLGKGQPLTAEESVSLKKILCQQFGLQWEETWTRDQKLEVLGKMGMVRRYGDRTWGVGDNKLPYVMTLNLIHLQDYKIPEKIWEAMDWSALVGANRFLLNDWCMQLNYLIPTTTALIKMIEGEDIMESLAYLGSGEGFKYIPDVLAPFAEREQMHWFNVIGTSELATLRKYKEKGNRHNLAKELRGRIPSGLLRDHFRRVWFAACGIVNTDWSSNVSSLKIEEKVRQFLQGINEVKVVRDGMLRGTGITYQELAHFAGLEIKPFHDDLVFHYDLIHMISDESGWETEENIETLRLIQEFIGDYLRNFDEPQRLLGTGGERVKERWVRERPGDARRILGIFEEWETEVDLPIMNRFLQEFFGQNFPNREARIAWSENWIKTHREDAERIFQVWPEFSPMKITDREQWLSDNPEIVEKIIHMTVDWPGRHVWAWGTMEAGRPGTGAEELEMAQWACGEDYVSRFYEHQKWPWRRYGPRFNVWEREKRVFRVMRRQKASMDFREEELKKFEFKDGAKVHNSDDIIVGRWFYDQLEWDPVPRTGDLKRHDRPGDPFGGIDPIKSMLMVTGEYYPGDPREVSPLWYGHSARRLIYRYASRNSPWYHIEHAKLAAKVHNSDWKEYWREHRLARVVAAPSKWFKILRILSLSGTLDPNEHVPYERAFGATQKEVSSYWAERKGLRFPNEEDVVKSEGDAEVTKYAAMVAAEFKKGTGGTLLSIVTGGRTGPEIVRMGRNAVVLGTAGAVGGAMLGLGPLILVTGTGGVVIGALSGWDRGDLVGGLSYLAGRFGGFLGDRLQRSDPETLALGYVPPRILGRRAWFLENNPIFKPFFPPPVTDDVLAAQEIAQAIATSKAELGGEGAKNK